LALTLEPGWHVYWLYAGDSGEPPAVEWSLSSVGRSGVPTYVIISGSSEIAPHVLPELLTRGIVLDAIRQAGAQRDSQILAPIPTGKTGS
jgi:thiol:disulfide interchange protein DsbD